MTLFKHTEPPKENGRYLTDLGFLFYQSEGEPVPFWTESAIAGIMEQRYPKHWFHKQPPKEIEDVLDMIKSALQARKDVIGSNINFIALSFKEAEQLLKLRAE